MADAVVTESIVRFESPGEDFGVEKLLLKAGYAAAAAERSPVIDPDELERLAFDGGRILYPRQWYLGYCAALSLVAEQLSGAAPHRLLSDTEQIATLFDKPRCQRRLAGAGVLVPRFWSAPDSYDQMREHLLHLGCRRAFVKLAHGSSSSGVVALYVDRRGARAVTSAELVRERGELKLYNSLRIRTYTDEHEIAALIDELCRHGVQFEEWLPKASLGGLTFDLRVVVIAGQARHVVVRTSRTPMTNLHLGNGRGDLQMLLEVHAVILGKSIIRGSMPLTVLSCAASSPVGRSKMTRVFQPPNTVIVSDPTIANAVISCSRFWKSTALHRRTTANSLTATCETTFPNWWNCYKRAGWNTAIAGG